MIVPTRIVPLENTVWDSVAWEYENAVMEREQPVRCYSVSKNGLLA